MPTIRSLNFVHGEIIQCSISGIRIPEGVIVVTPRSVFCLQDYREGSYPDNFREIQRSLGTDYRFSWNFGRLDGNLDPDVTSLVRTGRFMVPFEPKKNEGFVDACGHIHYVDDYIKSSDIVFLRNPKGILSRMTNSVELKLQFTPIESYKPLTTEDLEKKFYTEDLFEFMRYTQPLRLSDTMGSRLNGLSYAEQLAELERRRGQYTRDQENNQTRYRNYSDVNEFANNARNSTDTYLSQFWNMAYRLSNDYMLRRRNEIDRINLRLEDLRSDEQIIRRANTRRGRRRGNNTPQEPTTPRETLTNLITNSRLFRNTGLAPVETSTGVRANSEAVFNPNPAILDEDDFLETFEEDDEVSPDWI